MPERLLLTGNHAAAYGAMLSRAEVISAYPITPQTMIVELLSELTASGRLDAKFITVESEHSAMAACVGASAAGARAYTATSGQGLALMHEMLHWAVGARLPIVLTNVSRAMAPGWSIWSDQTRHHLAAGCRLDDAVRRERPGGPGLHHLDVSGRRAGLPAGHGRRWTPSSSPTPPSHSSSTTKTRSTPTCRGSSRSTTSTPPNPAPTAAWSIATTTSSCATRCTRAWTGPGGLLVEAGEEFGEVLGRRYAPVEEYMLDDAEYRDRLGRSDDLERPPGRQGLAGSRGQGRAAADDRLPAIPG